MPHTYTSIQRLDNDGEPFEIDIRVSFFYDQTPYELELSFEGASVEDQFSEQPRLTMHELIQIENWFYTKGYDHAQELALEDIASSYQTE